MKRRSYLISFIIILTVILSATFTAFSASAQETALSNGFTNVAFSNGYYGFCLDENLKGANSGDAFTPAGGTSAALSNQDNSDISQYLKVLFTQCFGDVFVSDGNGGYQIKDSSTIQSVVWHFSDGRYIWGEQIKLVNLVKAYTGPAIPDEGYTLQLDNGDVITFYFTVMIPDNSEVQYFFAYKIVVGQIPSHVHDYGKDWSFDENEHWHECECGDKSDKGGHSGGSANCVTPAECETCGQPYGEKDKDAHSGGTEIRGYVPATESAPGYTGDTHCVGCGEKLADGEPIPQPHVHDYGKDWSFDENEHWHECECGDKSDKGGHSGGSANCVTPAECETCGQPYGEKDKDAHSGGTEIRGYVPATESAPGYTGDTHCVGCGEKLADGEPIPQPHVHDYGKDWSFDENEHWHECECGDKSDKGGHSGGSANCVTPAECETCGQPYGEKDKDAHSGGTEIRGYVPATESAPGYTGDTHCVGCGEKLADGEPIPQLHVHDYDKDWSFDENEHWLECECGEKSDKGGHSGGSANCETPAECETCGQPYGEKDKDVHSGGTEIRGYVPATESAPGYTGDTHCVGCGEKLADGEPIPQLHVHDYGKDWSFDENEHWHECECGDKKDRGEHVYQGGVCIECDTVDPDEMPPKTSDDLDPCFRLVLLLLSIGGATWAVRTKKRHQS